MTKAKTGLKPIDTAVYGYWSALYLSFFSRRLYVDVGMRWRKFGFVYLLLVIGILSIPFSLRVAANFNKSFDESIVYPLKKLPRLYVQKGEISIDKPVPYLIQNDKGQVVLIVDTSGKIDTFNSVYPYLSILITKDTVYFKVPTPNLLNSEQARGSTAEPMAQKIDKSVNTVFDGSKFISDQSISNLKVTSLALIYPLIIVSMFTFFIILFPVLALLAQIFASVFFTFQISYFQASRLLIVASTPMMLALFTLLSLNLIFMGMGVLLITLLVIYYVFALYALKSESMQVARL